MKHFIFLILISLSLVSCDPRDRDLPAQFEGRINISAKILNPRDSIGINDTLRIQFECLDTIFYNGSKISVIYSNSDLAYTNIGLQKIDLSHAGSQGIAYGSVVFAPVGFLANNKSVLTFQNNGNSMKGEYDIIPKVSGVYFFDQILPGFLSANNGQYKLDIYWDYGNINRNHQLLIDSAGSNSGMDLFLQGRINSGLEVYGFKVK